MYWCCIHKGIGVGDLHRDKLLSIIILAVTTGNKMYMNL